MNIEIAKDLDELSQRAATRIFRLANEAIVERGCFNIALSGGSTPDALYSVMSEASPQWDKWFFFFGDERNVPPDDEQSNLRMANETLFSAIPPDARNIVAWGSGTGEPEAVADAYGERIRNHICGEDKESIPRFDLILLGMGTDGHTASLFPNAAALNETERIAVANFVPQMNAWRYTLTFPLINNAKNVIFLVSGSEKAVTLNEVIRGEQRPNELPSQSVQPENGELVWFIDEAAAEFLTR